MPAPASGKWAPSGRKRREIHAFTRENHALELILTLGVEEAVGAVIIGLGNEDLGRPVQIAVIGSGRVDKGLGGGDAVFLQHDHQHFGVDDRSGVEQFHGGKVTERPGENRENMPFPSSQAAVSNVGGKRVNWAESTR